ncbi:hypothetical protein J7J95_01415 [bacterium]|nr:hypothetical protein [bacterium]
MVVEMAPSRELKEKQILSTNFLENAWESLPTLSSQLSRKDQKKLKKKVGLPCWPPGWQGKYNKAAEKIQKAKNTIPRREISLTDAKAEIISLALWHILQFKGLIQRKGWEVKIDDRVRPLVKTLKVLKGFVPWRYGSPVSNLSVSDIDQAIKALADLTEGII